MRQEQKYSSWRILFFVIIGIVNLICSLIKKKYSFCFFYCFKFIYLPKP